MLTAVANRGKAAQAEVERMVKDFLADPPGPWLPEEFSAPHELLERSITDASKEGKTILVTGVHRVLKALFADFSVRRLTVKESRELLGSLIVAVNHPLDDQKNRAFLDFLYVAAKRPELFWEKVQPVEDIVGTSNDARKEFAERLWRKIPAPLKNHFFSLEPRPKPRLLRFLQRWGKEETRLQNALLDGEIVAVAYHLGTMSKQAYVVRTPSNEAIVLLSNPPWASNSPYHCDLGNASLKEASPRKVGEFLRGRLKSRYLAQLGRGARMAAAVL